MRSTCYTSLTTLALAAALAACSTTDQPTQTAAVPTPPVAPSAAPAAPAGTGKLAAVPPAAPRPTETAPAPSKASGELVSKPKRGVGRAAQPAAVASEPEFACGGLRSDTERAIAAARDSAEAINLPAFCAQAAPGVQVYQVQAGRDTMLVGQQGTRLIIPARAFDVPATSGPVRLELREFYSTADIVLAGLGTRAGRDVLETGGMLHLYAAANGQTVHLRPGKQLLVQLPTQQQLPGMRLYEGVSIDASHAPDWQLPGTGLAALDSARAGQRTPTSRRAMGQWVALHPPKSPRWPRFEQGRETLLKEFDRLMPDAPADQARLRRKRHVGKDEQQLLRELSRHNHAAIRHAIILDVALDSTGVLRAAELATGDSVLGAKVLAAVRQLPLQRPASFVSRQPHTGRALSTAQGSFIVLYTRAGERRIGFHWDWMDKQVQEELSMEMKRQRAIFGRQFAQQFNRKESTPLTLEGGLYYELTAGGLGWINCDRLLEPGPRIQFAVSTPDTSTVVSLVFKNQRSILASSRTEGRAAVFEQVPAGAAATVVALRRENGVTYLATSGVSLGQAAPPALDFRPVSLEQLRTELAAL